MNTIKQVLTTARELIALRSNWTQGAFAKDCNETPVHSSSPSACKWCSAGAIIASADRIADYNDSHTHAEVLAAFDKAIAAS